ncbi:MAG: ribosomal RNA small subunit methyltransferase A, partial [Cetobacterium sp.]
MSFKHKKKFGQNFLTDQNDVLNRIMEVSDVKEDEHIIEIGPGEGALTALLLEKAENVTCIEIDTDLEKILTKKYASNPKFNLIMQDVLTVDLKNVLSKGRVVANIPYYITSPIINKIIENRDIISEMFIMVQKEVAERVCSKS